jgi:hypothetical protein
MKQGNTHPLIVGGAGHHGFDLLRVDILQDVNARSSFACLYSTRADVRWPQQTSVQLTARSSMNTPEPYPCRRHPLSLAGSQLTRIQRYT